MLLTIYPNKKRVIVGELRNNIFKKTVYKSKHLMRKLNSWGFDYRTMVNVVLPEAKVIIVHDRDENKTYQCTPKEFGKIKDGTFMPSDNVHIRHYKDEHEDDFTQIFLPLNYWEILEEKDGN